MTTEGEGTEVPAPNADERRRRIRKARWIGIGLVIVLGGAVAAWAGALPDGVIGRVLAYGVLAFIVLLVVARFIPDTWLGGRIGRLRGR